MQSNARVDRTVPNNGDVPEDAMWPYGMPASTVSEHDEAHQISVPSVSGAAGAGMPSVGSNVPGFGPTAKVPLLNSHTSWDENLQLLAVYAGHPAPPSQPSSPNDGSMMSSIDVPGAVAGPPRSGWADMPESSDPSGIMRDVRNADGSDLQSISAFQTATEPNDNMPTFGSASSVDYEPIGASFPSDAIPRGSASSGSDIYSATGRLGPVSHDPTQGPAGLVGQGSDSLSRPPFSCQFSRLLQVRGKDPTIMDNSMPTFGASSADATSYGMPPIDWDLVTHDTASLFLSLLLETHGYSGSYPVGQVSV
ncbi:hypothetical protein B0H14DRAFT_1052887 [Mycena olivaceomarginata]|nr:hypothetical protein B0H14DRAFT_1052887 [Mycena olivaceomarginata]